MNTASPPTAVKEGFNVEATHEWAKWNSSSRECRRSLPPPCYSFAKRTWAAAWEGGEGGTAAPGGVKGNIMFGEIKDKGGAGTLKAPLNLSSPPP